MTISIVAMFVACAVLAVFGGLGYLLGLHSRFYIKQEVHKFIQAELRFLDGEIIKLQKLAQDQINEASLKAQKQLLEMHRAHEREHNFDDFEDFDLEGNTNLN